jgi:ABC-2 type transport system permease protein
VSTASTAVSTAVRDSVTMLRRNLLHALRYPSATIWSVAIPGFFLLLFGGVFGRSLGAGLGGVPNGGVDYIDYVTPAIILMAATTGGTGTALSVSMDMSEGIINRFRTMAISRASVLTGHVVGSVIQTMVSIVLVIGVALVMGFRPTANVVEWVAVFGLLAVLTLAITWPSAAAGLVARGPESASNMPIPFVILPLLGSGFVPTDSMPAGLRWFAEHQPFTPVTETLRGLLLGTPTGNDAVVTLAWCASLGLAGYLWARTAFNRDPKPR